MPQVNQSRIKAWRRCHRLFDYKYNQRLQRKRPAPPLIRGTILHEMLDARALKTDPMAVLTKYEEQYKTLFIEEREEYGDIINDLRRVFEGYCLEWPDEKMQLLASEEFVATDLGKGMRFVGRIDKRYNDGTRHWLADHKSGKNIPGVAARYSDLQTLMYIWAFNREHSSPVDKINGVLWDYIRVKPPTIPDVLVKGGLSKAKNINTDYRTYLEAIVANNLNPSDYAERLADLKAQASPFYLRVTLPNPPTVMVDQVVADFRNTAVEMTMLSGVSTARNMTKDCSWCEYHAICSAELRGHDADFVRKAEYIVEDPKDGYETTDEI